MKPTTCIEPVNAFQRPSAQACGWMGPHYTYDVPAPRTVVDAIASAAQSWHYDAPCRHDVTAGAGSTTYGYVAAGMGEFAAESDDRIQANPINRVDWMGLQATTSTAPATAPAVPKTGRLIASNLVKALGGTVNIYLNSTFLNRDDFIQLQYTMAKGGVGNCKTLHWLQFRKDEVTDQNGKPIPGYAIDILNGGGGVETTHAGTRYLDVTAWTKKNGKLDANFDVWYDSVGLAYRGANDDEISIFDRPDQTISDKNVSKQKTDFDAFLVNEKNEVFWHVHWVSQNVTGIGNGEIPAALIVSEEANNLSSIGATASEKQWSIGKTTFTNRFLSK